MRLLYHSLIANIIGAIYLVTFSGSVVVVMWQMNNQP